MIQERPDSIYRLLLTGILIVFSVHLFSQEDRTPPDLRFDTIELSAFMDGLVNSHMLEYRAAGGVAVVVHENEVIFRKAYGYQDIDSEIPTDAARTLFRLGSVSKLFTWIAVLQQAEQGQLDLDEDINIYLEGFSVPGTYEEPVTLRSLMSHTPGFEDILLRLFLREGDPVPGIEEVLREQMPKRVRPPMEEAAYSNHGTGLAQYIVEQVSGTSFETYVEENILIPLGMEHTTFRQPLPGHLREHMASGYAFQDGRFIEKGFEVVPMTGAGGASSTADDMTIFMKTLLNHTVHDTISLLDSASYSLMMEPAIFHAEKMNPALHGFIDMSPAHVRIIGHGGNTFLFHSMLALFPDHSTGVFMSFSGENAAPVCNLILHHLVDRYFPVTERDTASVTLSAEYLGGFAGRYLPNRRPHSDILKIIGMMTALEVSVEGDMLSFTDLYGETHLMSAVDSTTFYIKDRNIYAGFERTADEKATKFYISNFPIMAWERAGGVYSAGLHIFILLATMLTSLYILVVWPWLYFARRNYDKRHRMRLPLPFFPKAAAWVASLFIILFYTILMMSAGGTEIVFGVPSSLKTGLILPLAVIPLLLIMAISSIYIWNTPNLKRLSRIFYLFATAIMICGILQLYFFNLLGWQY